MSVGVKGKGLSFVVWLGVYVIANPSGPVSGLQYGFDVGF